MYVKYGSHSHEAGEVALAISKEAVYEGTIRKYIRERWDLQGMLIGEVAALSTKIAALEAAYAYDNYDIALYTDAGVITEHVMLAANQIGGNRVVQPPTYPDGAGAQYATMRTYSIAVEGLRAAGSSSLIHWAESIEWRGTGGANWTYQVPLLGSIQAQQLSQSSVVTITQAGEAVGESVYPTFPSPIWPSQEIEPARVRRMERPQMNDTTRRIQWSYTFLAPSALPGYPTAR